MSSNEILILKLNRGRTMLRRIAVASEAMRRKKRTRKCKAIEIDLAALAELNREYGSLSEEDRLALDELNAEGEELKQKLAVLRGEQKKRKGDTLALRTEAGRVSACLNPLCGVEASGRIVRSGYVVPRIIDPRPSIRPAA